MSETKDQHKAGTPEKPRGQETGNGPAEDQNREAMQDTPALRGDRKFANKMFADESSQHIAANDARPRSNSPSVPNAIPDVKLGESGGEREFKERNSKE